MMSTILEAISRGSVPERDRISLVDDQFALARAGFQGLDRVLQFCRAFVGEMRYSVWSVLSEGLAQVQTLLEEAFYPLGDEVVFPEPSKEICGLNKLYIELALPVYKKIGFEPTSADSNNDRLLRPIIISILGRMGHGDVISKAQTAFERHYAAMTSAPVDQATTTDQSKLISPDLRTAVYCMCLRNGGDEEFKRLLELHDRATLDEERVRILSSLGATTNADLIKRLFDLTFTEYVRKQDRFRALLGVIGTAGGRRALWNLVRSRIATLHEDLGTSHLLARVLEGSVSNFASQKRYDEIKAFFTDHKVPCPRVIQQALEAVQINVNQWKRDGKAVGSHTSHMSKSASLHFKVRQCALLYVGLALPRGCKEVGLEQLFAVETGFVFPSDVWCFLTHPQPHASEGGTTSSLKTRVLRPTDAFFTDHKVPCPRVIQQALEAVQINVNQWKRDGKAVGRFLHKLVC
ncbi:Puromycin-sensitive aminopeptidase [Taenia crassiceps]|uniref:Puromycin-sensitive aminopeptidase n=1 Tax=Taenia crassiceps TaxID=6207 RepID=A0ABR4Q3C7_9CEST